MFYILVDAGILLCFIAMVFSIGYIAVLEIMGAIDDNHE